MLGISGIIIWVLLLWTSSVLGLQIAELVYGTFQACEIAYFSYIYAKTDRKHYQVVTSHSRAAISVGRFLSAATSQILVLNQWMNYRQLNYLTLAALIMATVWAFFIPRVKTSLYFNPGNNDGQLTTTYTHNRMTNALKLIWIHFKTSYTNTNVLMWSFYYAIALCLYVQSTAYIQVLWIAIDNSQEVIWNGAVESVLTLLSAIASLVAGKVHMHFLRHHNRLLITLIIMSSFQGLALLAAALSTTLLSCYIAYISFGVFYAFMMTIAASSIAQELMEDSFGLVFGVNTLIASSVQTILTLTVVSNGFVLSPVGQYTVYSWCFIALAIIYFAKLIFNFLTCKKV